MKLTVKQINDILVIERQFQNDHYDNNTSKKITNIDYLEKLLDNVAETCVMNNIAPVRNDGKHIRTEHQMVNTGDVVECIIKLVLHGKKSVTKSKADGYDIVLDGKRYEIKACLSHSSKNTKVKRATVPVLLVNQMGVWQMDIDEINEYADRHGRLQPRGEYKCRHEKLSELLGYEW